VSANPTFDETVTKAAQAIYARTKTGRSIRWELLPRNVQEEIQSVARVAITVALVDLRESIKEEGEV
jgi:hypothetical protein